MLSGGEIDLVLLDLALPGMHGTEVARAIRSGRAGPENREVPIVAITAYATEEDRHRAEEAGMNGFISKPFAPETLEQTIRSVVASGRPSENEEREIADASERVQEILGELRRALGPPVELHAVADRAQEFRTLARDRGDASGAELAFRLILAARRGAEERVRELIEGMDEATRDRL
jgi:DNA-binding response OmpR family regulator